MKIIGSFIVKHHKWIVSNVIRWRIELKEIAFYMKDTFEILLPITVLFLHSAPCIYFCLSSCLLTQQFGSVSMLFVDEMKCSALHRSHKEVNFRQSRTVIECFWTIFASRFLFHFNMTRKCMLFWEAAMRCLIWEENLITCPVSRTNAFYYLSAGSETLA